MFEETLKVIKSGVGIAFPCAAVAVGLGNKVFEREFFGHRQIKPTVSDITEETLFDIASLSKLVATSMIALKFIDSDKLSLNDKISSFLDYAGNYGDCEIRRLMTHTSGTPSWLPLFDMTHVDGNVIRTIFDSDRCSETGKEVCYSCMGYIVLGCILEAVGGETLDKLAQKYVFEPLGMKTACYNPSADAVTAATEFYSNSGEWATGHVHDENAYFLGGVSGNAGVFATLDDMISFAKMCSQKGIASDSNGYLSKELFDLAIKNHTPDKSESRGLGFQIKGTQGFPGGDLLLSGSYGHTGFTGTSLYVDCETGLWGVLLTNAVHYGRDNRSEYFLVRKNFYDTMITEYKNLHKEDKI